ncbi:hypothetical protein IW262DRAFT_1467146 [Armillaria fumosa]|nr:hypothetical protein IW262DRAFT_1467146 [Armillaria fumosa]
MSTYGRTQGNQGPFRPWEHQTEQQQHQSGPQVQGEDIQNAIHRDLERIVQEYFDERITKTNAIRQISTYIGRSCEQRRLVYDDAMLEPWVIQLDAHDRSLTDAADRGRRQHRGESPRRESREQATSSSPSRERGRVRSHRRSRSPSERPRRRRRRRSPSPSDSSSDSDSPSEETRDEGKKRKLDPSLFDWEVNRTIQNAIPSPAHLAIKKRYENFSADPRECLRLIKNSHPPPFTDAGFRSIVYSTPVNFDEILSYFKSPSVPTGTTHSLGNGLVLQTANTGPSLKVTCRDSWRYAWVRYERVLNHIFRGRQAELETYYEFIQNIFDNRRTWLDTQIIAFDKACRALIASARGRLLFSDVHQFAELKESHFQASGLAYVAPAGETTASGGSKDGGKPKKRRRETTVDTDMCAPTASQTIIPASRAPVETQGSLPELAAIQADLSRFAGRANRHVHLENDDGDTYPPDWDNYDELELAFDKENTTVVSHLPRYMRGYAWRDPTRFESRTAHYTEIDDPLPRPPAKEFENTTAMNTIRNYPHLFNVSTPI